MKKYFTDFELNQDYDTKMHIVHCMSNGQRHMILPPGSIIRLWEWLNKCFSPKAVLFLWIIYVISVLFLLCFCVRLFINAFWSPAGKGLTSWLLFVMFNCDIFTFSLVSLVRCGA